MSHIDDVLAGGEGHDLHAFPGLGREDIDYEGDDQCEICGARCASDELECLDDSLKYACPDCAEDERGSACGYCGVGGGNHRHGCPER